MREETTQMTWRTRSLRFTPKTIGFSTSIQRQDRVIGFCVHRSAFALPVGTLHTISPP
jgi:hypothetical protein